MASFSLLSYEKLKNANQFAAVTKQGQKITGKCFLMIYRHNDVGYARLGITVSKKTSKKAVVRNRLKRLVRESFRMHKHQMLAIDIVVISRKRASGASACELRQELTKLWQQLIESSQQQL